MNTVMLINTVYNQLFRMKISNEYIRFELNVKGILQKKTEC